MKLFCANSWNWGALSSLQHGIAQDSDDVILESDRCGGTPIS